MMLMTITAQKAAVHVSITRAGTICATRSSIKTLMTIVKEPECEPNQRKGNYFYDRFDEKVDESKHRSGQNQPFPIAVKMNTVHEPR